MTTILVVEDEISLREAFVPSCREDYAVEAVGDGVSGVETARRIKPDLIVLDIMLPHI